MATPRTLQNWTAVETEGDFIGYLGLLVADVQRLASGASAGKAFRDVPGFLHGWARWMDDALASGTYPDLLESPSRRALAGQLFHVHTAVPAAAVGGSVISDPDQVTSAADLACWLRHLGNDCTEDGAARQRAGFDGGWGGEGEWAHGTDLTRYLEAWHACLRDHHAGAGRVRFKARTWAEVAGVLETGKFYE